MLLSTDVENAIPPVNARTTAAKIPSMVMYSFC